MPTNKSVLDIEVISKKLSEAGITNSNKDFGNLELDCFFDNLKKSVEKVLPYVKKKGHVVIFIKNLQPNGKNTNLLHA